MARGKKKETALSPAERLQAALVPESEQPYKVPENWCWVKLDSLKNDDNGFFDGDWILSENMDPTGNVRLLQLSDIGIGEFLDKSNKHINEKTFKDLECSELNEGDIMISRMAEPIARSCIVPKFPYKVITAVDVAVLRCNPNLVINRYLNYICNTKWFTELAFSLARGTTRVRITRKNLGEMPIPLPPWFEQKRIVDRIENLFTKLDEAKQKAQDALDSFETRKAAILHRAFTGELTAQWRKEHGVGMESWETKRLSDVSNLQTGLMKGKHYIGKTVMLPYLRVANVQDGFLNLNEIKEIEVSEELVDRYLLKNGDVLFTEGGDYDKLGRGTVWREQIQNCLHQNHIFVVRPDTSVLNPYFLSYQAGSRYGKQYFLKCSKQTTNLASINSTQLKGFPVLMPSIEEQVQIVSLIDNLLAKEQQAKEAAEKVLKQIDLTKKAILARAFRGELGTNNPSEENAIILIENIIAQGEQK